MADNKIRKYRLGKALLKRALLKGFILQEDDLYADPHMVLHDAFLPGLDSMQPGCVWGRLSMKCQLSAESMLTVRVFASDQDVVIREGRTVRVDDFLLDPEIPDREKERLFLLGGGMERSGAADVLFQGQKGRFLWLWLQVSSEEESVLQNMRVYVPGDNFFATFPQVYQNQNDFLRRYLSVFSTLYQEFQEKLDTLPMMLDVDTAPKELLPVFASWLGMEIDEMLFTPEELRILLKAAPRLMARKGTRWALEEAVKLLVKEDVFIVERNLIRQEQEDDTGLYGNTPHDFTVMVGTQKEEKLRLRLQFLIDQFKPVRSRAHIIFLKEHAGLDGYTYLDINGRMWKNMPGYLDDGKALIGMTYLE